MADNKVEIKINVDSSQAQKGITGVNDMLSGLKRSAMQTSDLGLKGISSALETIKTTASEPIKIALPSADIEKTAAAIGGMKTNIPAAVMSMSALGSSMSSVKNYGESISATSTAFDTIRSSAETAGKTLSSAFSIKLPADEVEQTAAALGDILNESKPVYNGLTDVAVGLTGIKSSAVTMAVGTIFAFNQVASAISIVKDTATSAFGIIHDGAQAMDIDRVFHVQAANIGADADEILAKIKASTQNTITDMQAKMIGNQAGIAKMSADDVATTMAYLRQYANATGKSFDQLMTTIFTGLTRGSTLMLDDAGIIIDQTDLIARKEKELGKELSATGQKKVIVAEALRQMSDNMKQFGDTTLSATNKLDRLTTRFSNWWTNFKMNMAGDINDTLVLATGAISIQEKINALQGKIKRYSPAASYDPVNALLLKKWKAELKDLQDSLNKSTSKKKKTKPKKKAKKSDGIKFEPEDFALNEDKDKKDPLADIKSKLENLQDTEWQIKLDIKTVGLDEFQKRRIEAEAEYTHTAEKLNKDRDKDNSAYTDKAIAEAKKIRDSKLTLINAEERNDKKKKVADDLKNFTLEVDTTAAEAGLDEFDKQLLKLRKDFETVFNSPDATKAQKDAAQAAFNKASKTVSDARAKDISDKLEGFKIEVDTSSADQSLDEFDQKLKALTEKYNQFLKNTKGLSAEQIAQAGTFYNKSVINIEHQRQNSTSDMNMERFIGTTSMTDYESESLRLDQKLDTGQINKALYDSQKAMLDYRASIGDVEKGLVSLGGTITNKDILGAFNAMTPAVSDFLTTFAETGEFDVSALANGLLKSVQAYAAQQTAELLMQGLFHTAMTFIEPEDPTHAAKAATAYTSAAVFGSIVAGSGLAGMAHEGIDSIPEDGTWLLKKKERIVGASLNQDLTTFLSSQTSNMSDNSSGHTFVNNFYSNDAEGVKQLTPYMQKQIENSLMKSDRFRKAYGGK